MFCRTQDDEMSRQNHENKNLFAATRDEEAKERTQEQMKKLRRTCNAMHTKSMQIHRFSIGFKHIHIFGAFSK